MIQKRQRTPFITFLTLMMSLGLTACQSMSEKFGTKMIAGGFTTSTHVQRLVLNTKSDEKINVIEDIAYGDAPRHRMDLYLPKQTEALGLIVWVHGGGWISGNKNDAKGYYIRLAEQGYAVAAINYSLAPESKFPTQLQEIDQALAFVNHQGQQWQLPMQNVFLAGDSAGANMVSHYVALLSDSSFAAQSFALTQFMPTFERAHVKGLILHCGIYDLASFAQAKDDQWRLLNWGVAELTDAYMPIPTIPETRHTQLSQHSPYTANLSQFPPVLISGGHLDFLTQSQGIPFRNRLLTHGVEVKDLLYVKGNSNAKGLLLHEFQFNLSLDAAQDVFNETLNFIKLYGRAEE